MLTSFFGKSNPVNFLLLSSYILVVVFTKGLLDPMIDSHWTSWFLLLLNAGLLVFAMLLVDFIVRKNTLTQSHTLGIYVFSCIVLLFPALLQWDALAALILGLLGFRRMFSMSSEKNTEKKILDASVWMLLASIFYFWNLLWFIPLFLAIAFMTHKQFRHFFIPVMGSIGMFLIITAYHFIIEDSFDWFWRWLKWPSFDFVAYGTTSIMVGITMLLSFYFWALFHRLGMVSDVPKKIKNNYILLTYTSIASIFVVLMSFEKNGAELVFLAAPTSLIIAGYLERPYDLWLKEIMMWLLLLMPIMILFL